MKPVIARIQTTPTLCADQTGGLLLPPDDTTVVHRKLVVTLEARHRLPAVYSFCSFVADGGLMSYAVDVTDLFRQSASYVDRILKREKASYSAIAFWPSRSRSSFLNSASARA